MWLLMMILTLGSLTLADRCPEVKHQGGEFWWVSISFPVSESGGEWQLQVNFSRPVNNLQLESLYVDSLDDGRSPVDLKVTTKVETFDLETYNLTNVATPLPSGELHLQLGYLVHHAEEESVTSVALNDVIICSDDADYDYVADIENGAKSLPGQWNWLAAIYKKMKGGLQFVCGGSLVARRIVVTAAHCVKDMQGAWPANSVVVSLGRHNLELWGEVDEGQIKTVAEVLPHPSHNGKNGFDLAVLVLFRPATYNQKVAPVSLWDTNLNHIATSSKTGTVVGWGLRESGSGSVVPYQLDVPLVSDKECRDSSAALRKHLFEGNTLCAGSRNESGPCSGDSGGGLYTFEGLDWVLRGVVSLSVRDMDSPAMKECNQKEFSLYTDMAHHTAWLLQLMHKYALAECGPSELQAMDETSKRERLERADDCWEALTECNESCIRAWELQPSRNGKTSPCPDLETERDNCPDLLNECYESLDQLLGEFNSTTQQILTASNVSGAKSWCLRSGRREKEIWFLEQNKLREENGQLSSKLVEVTRTEKLQSSKERVQNIFSKVQDFTTAALRDEKLAAQIAGLEGQLNDTIAQLQTCKDQTLNEAGRKLVSSENVLSKKQEEWEENRSNLTKHVELLKKELRNHENVRQKTNELYDNEIKVVVNQKEANKNVKDFTADGRKEGGLKIVMKNEERENLATTPSKKVLLQEKPWGVKKYMLAEQLAALAESRGVKKEMLPEQLAALAESRGVKKEMLPEQLAALAESWSVMKEERLADWLALEHEGKELHVEHTNLTDMIRALERQLATRGQKDQTLSDRHATNSRTRN